MLIPWLTVLSFNLTLPAVYLTKVVIILKIVDFPAPFGPSNANT